MFLADNKGRDGVVTLPSGLQYKVLTAGQGSKPTVDDTVVCHYRGTLIDGKEFDSSYARRQPATFAVKRVIKGWSEAFQQMPVGSKWQLFIPSGLAYGERAASPAIGPNATLIFEVELISIGDPTRAEATDGTASNAALAAPAAARMVVSFKLDPRLLGATYGGERWVMPPTYTEGGEGKTCTVEARALGLDAKGKSVAISATWTPTDPRW